MHFVQVSDTTSPSPVLFHLRGKPLDRLTGMIRNVVKDLVQNANIDDTTFLPHSRNNTDCPLFVELKLRPVFNILLVTERDQLNDVFSSVLEFEDLLVARSIFLGSLTVITFPIVVRAKGHVKVTHAKTIRSRRGARCRSRRPRVA